MLGNFAIALGIIAFLVVVLCLLDSITGGKPWDIR